MNDSLSRFALGSLSDPRQHTDPLQVEAEDKTRCIQLLHDMLLIRRAEECIGDLVVSGDAKTPCHLGIGQEAIAVGLSEHLVATDRVFGGHRSHAHFLALGGNVDALIAEVLGKSTGASRGMGGSMHLIGKEVGFHGSVPIVGATIPIAVGAALAAKMDGGTDIAVCYFGDGAAEEGVLHESLNLASVHQLPILFVCENNLFSSHLDLGDRQPAARVARFGEAHCIGARTIDGNDVLQVSRVGGEFIAKIREDRRPQFLEAVTYRHRGHVGPNEDVDVGVHRAKSELNAWKKRDPIKRLIDGLVSQGHLATEELKHMESAIHQRITLAREKALAASYPDDEMLHELVLSTQV